MAGRIQHRFVGHTGEFEGRGESQRDQDDSGTRIIGPADQDQGLLAEQDGSQKDHDPRQRGDPRHAADQLREARRLVGDAGHGEFGQDRSRHQDGELLHALCQLIRQAVEPCRAGREEIADRQQRALLDDGVQRGRAIGHPEEPLDAGILA